MSTAHLADSAEARNRGPCVSNFRELQPWTLGQTRFAGLCNDVAKQVFGT
jgi:hypothetical protein